MEGNAFRVAKRGYILIISGRNDHRSLLIFFSPFFFARIRPGEEITRHYDNEDEGGLVSTAARGTPSLARCAHAVIFVVNANDLCLSENTEKHFVRSKSSFDEMVIISQVSVIYSRLRKILRGNVTFSRDVQNYNLRLDIIVPFIRRRGQNRQ